MKIGINGNEANVAHRVGVGQYAFELLSELSKLIIKNQSVTTYLSSQPLLDMPKATDSWQYSIFGPKRLWTLTGLQKKLFKEKISGRAPSVFFTPTHYTPVYMPLPSVIAIMDMSFERFPEYFNKRDYYQLKYWTWMSTFQAEKILTISKFCKTEIERIYPFAKGKVVVTYPGYDKERFNRKVKSQGSKFKKISLKYKIYNHYLLYIGTLQPRKNLTMLVEAFAQLKDKSTQLVIVGMISEGRGGWMYQGIFEKARSLRLEDRVIFTGYVPDEELPYLLAGATGYVLPSLYEGFGIPAIEAMATGVPVIVSKMSSLPEICGEAAIYIDDPYKVRSLRRALQEALLQTPSERAKRVELGLRWVKRYNWEKTARQTLDVLLETQSKK